jgi:hypothetical protein
LKPPNYCVSCMCLTILLSPCNSSFRSDTIAMMRGKSALEVALKILYGLPIFAVIGLHSITQRGARRSFNNCIWANNISYRYKTTLTQHSTASPGCAPQHAPRCCTVPESEHKREKKPQIAVFAEMYVVDRSYLKYCSLVYWGDSDLVLLLDRIFERPSFPDDLLQLV